jgi:hypothetical protein
LKTWEKNRLCSAAEMFVASGVGHSFGVPLRLITMVEPTEIAYFKRSRVISEFNSVFLIL